MNRKENRQGFWRRLSPKNWTRFTYVLVFSIIGVLFIGGTAFVFGNPDLDNMGFPDEEPTVELSDDVKETLENKTDAPDRDSQAANDEEKSKKDNDSNENSAVNNEAGKDKSKGKSKSDSKPKSDKPEPDSKPEPKPKSDKPKPKPDKPKDKGTVKPPKPPKQPDPPKEPEKPKPVPKPSDDDVLEPTVPKEEDYPLGNDSDAPENHTPLD